MALVRTELNRIEQVNMFKRRYFEAEVFKNNSMIWCHSTNDYSFVSVASVCLILQIYSGLDQISTKKPYACGLNTAHMPISCTLTLNRRQKYSHNMDFIYILSFRTKAHLRNEKIFYLQAATDLKPCICCSFFHSEMCSPHTEITFSFQMTLRWHEKCAHAVSSLYR